MHCGPVTHHCHLPLPWWPESPMTSNTSGCVTSELCSQLKPIFIPFFCPGCCFPHPYATLEVTGCALVSVPGQVQPIKPPTTAKPEQEQFKTLGGFFCQKFLHHYVTSHTSESAGKALSLLFWGFFKFFFQCSCSLLEMETSAGRMT